MTLVFHPLAEREFIAAARFYETRAPRLGADFIRQVEHAMRNCGSSEGWAPVRGHCDQATPHSEISIRRCIPGLSPRIFQCSRSCICAAGQVIGSGGAERGFFTIAVDRSLDCDPWGGLRDYL